MQNQNSNVKIGNPAISISINWSKIAQNYSLRISNSKREVKLTIPKNGSYNQALEFAKSRENWIQSKLLNHVPEVILSYGSKILYQGQELIIQPSHNKNISISDKQIFISGPENLISGKIKGFLKTKARDYLDYSSRQYSEKLGKQFKKITLRDTKSRWGSCTSDGKLMFSWRLIMAPPEILDYVAAHEVAHLSHLNHSKEFWNTVAFLLPEFSNYQNWLKINGQLLQRYRF